MNCLICTLVVGAGATIVMDLWGWARKPLLGVEPPNYALVGRWLGHMAKGRFHHESITRSPIVQGERFIGWIVHYMIGFLFAAALICIWDCAWLQHPTITPALIVGLGSVAAPFLLMQPGMGAGIAASRTPRPAAVRLQSLMTHTVFGFGLYISGWVAQSLCT
jgi:hypothetical protein